MNAITAIFFNIALICIEVWMIVYASGAFYKRKLSNKAFLLSALMLLAVYILIMQFFGGHLNSHLWLKYLINIIIILLWLKCAYWGTLMAHCYFCIFIISYINVIDGLFLLISPSFGGSIQFALDNPYSYFALCCCSKSFELMGIIIIHHAKYKHFNASTVFGWADWGRVTFFPLATSVVAVFISRILLIDLRFAKEIAACLFVMLVIDIISINFLDRLEASQQAIRENAVLRQNLKLESEHIASLQENYEQQRKQTHDFYNQLATLHGMAEKGVSLEVFSKYLGTLLATKPPAVFYINTHRTVVDVIMCQKVPIARDKGIDFQLQLEDLSHFPLPDDALVVILTNLIDNAIEACEKVPNEQERFIQLVMKIEEKTAWLCIENTTIAPVDIHNNYVLTTKGDPLLHGYGLKNISALINQYNGMYILDYLKEDRRFCFYSKFPIPG